MIKHTFELTIKSTTSDVTLRWNPTISKWEAVDGAGKLIARRKNVAVLVAELNK